MYRYVQIIFFLILSNILFSQEEGDIIFKVETTADTLFFGNYIGVKYTFENIQGDLEPPSFDGFEIVGGPNVSSQFSMVNGAVSQSASYEYILRPRDIGVIKVSPAMLKNGDEELSSGSIVIVVVDNPEGIRQSTRRYNKSSAITSMPDIKTPMSPQDSLRMKLKKVKAKKI